MERHVLHADLARCAALSGPSLRPLRLCLLVSVPVHLLLIRRYDNPICLLI